MSKTMFIYTTFILLALTIASFFIPTPYGILISTFLIIAYSAYLLLLTRSDRIDFNQKIRNRIRICALLAIIFGFVVFFAVVWNKMNHYHKPDPKGIIPSTNTLQNMQRSTR